MKRGNEQGSMEGDDCVVVMGSGGVLAVGLLNGLDTNATQHSSWADTVIYDELDVNWMDRHRLTPTPLSISR